MEAKVVKIGDIKIGANYPIAIQSMLKRPVSFYTKNHLNYLYNLGCDIMRFSIINESAEELVKFVKRSPFPLVADIQGSVNQALMALEAGVAGVRINPGNFDLENLKKIINLSRQKNAAIRIGINKASIGEKNIFDEIKRYVKYFEQENFENLVVSIKSSSSKETLQLNKDYSKLFLYPLHLGLTEAGFGVISAVRSTLVLSTLLREKIGSTIRYSISGPEEDEIRSAAELLSEIGVSKRTFNLISCPMCSRSGVDTDKLSRLIEKYIFTKFNIRNLNLTLAIMGCPVNGRGEAKEADIAVCACKDKTSEIYIKGEFYNKVKDSELQDCLCKIIFEYNARYKT